MATFDYTSRDYYSIREDLLNRASAMPIGADWTSRSSSDFGVMLVDLWAYMGDVLHYYVDRAAAETYLGTATQRESVLALANLLDYSPSSVSPANALVTLTTTDGFVSPTSIPKDTALVAQARSSSETTTYFVTTEDVVLTTANPSVDVSVVEGIVESYEEPISASTGLGNKSNGSPNQKFTLRYKGVVPSSIEVFVYEGQIVNGSASAVPYLYVDRLSDYSYSEKIFTIETSADGVTKLVFGNGINGKIPTNGASIKVSYLRSTGSSGNIEANRINAFKNVSPTGVRISYSTASSGGFDAESLASMKANLPLLFRTQNRAVSLQDFKDLALRIPGVVKATASASGSTVTVYPISYQADYISTTFGASVAISTNLRNETKAYFEPRQMLGASVSVASSIDLTPVYIRADIYVKDGYVQKWVNNDVAAAIDEFFTFDNVYFDQTLTLGQIYRAMLNVDGVDYVNITTFNITNAANSIIANNKITAATAKLLRKGAEYQFTMYNGVVG